MINDRRMVEIFRYDPRKDARPYMQSFELELEIDPRDRMPPDVLARMKSALAMCFTLETRRSTGNDRPDHKPRTRSLHS